VHKNLKIEKWMVLLFGNIIFSVSIKYGIGETMYIPTNAL
jgi:hypothetical protein